MKYQHSNNRSTLTEHELQQRLRMQDAIEKKRIAFEEALKKHSEYSEEKIKQKGGFFLVGERFITPKGKFEILDIDSGYNETLGKKDWLLTIENYNNFVRMTIWYSDLLQRYEAGEAVLITFKS
jgi:hypothetical protein